MPNEYTEEETSGFFKDFKDDFSQAVNELVPGEDSLGTEDELLVDTLEGEPDMEAEASKA